MIKSELAAQIERVLTLDPSRAAVEYRGKGFSWGDIGNAMSCVSTCLDRAELGDGAAVGVVVSNSPQMLAAVMGVILSGRCMVTINPHQSAEALAMELRRLQLPSVVVDEVWAENPLLLSVVREIGCQLIVTRGSALAESVAEKVTAPNNVFHQSLPDTAMLMLSSGTTGPAKRIALKFKNFEHAILGATFYEAGNAGELSLKRSLAFSTQPLVHIGGIFTAFMNLVVGRGIVMFDKFNVQDWHAAIIQHRPKLVSLAPAAIRMIYDAGVPVEDLSSLIAIRAGSAPLSPDFADAFKERYGIPILDSYGATEFGGGVAGWTWPDYQVFGDRKRGSVGRANPGISLRIVDEDSGSVLSSGEKGLLEVQGKQIGDGDWVRTTDLAKIDEDGFLYILGRADDVIIRGGFKISPQTVVTELKQYPGVLDAAVVGLPDERLGQLPVAALELESDARKPDESDVRDFLKQRMVAYQVPARILVVDELPRTPSMKISQPGVKALFNNHQ
ncbi:long-chain fatty acid--CoA ligase [Spongiibacter sp. KMU-166]|uniref:Long-chain fatty acid--CoA ligase n=1 Tax=Spongiibacter thalassae TaxID=2721624 RepID=A0ABX1GBJ0_9GAMM|nr:fatty acid--CoA ligase family protein [Spongiibacter thalassae]NKI15968.1 long-chain fatty acid--CoA ligase [Spongiibacter thalassae]